MSAQGLPAHILALFTPRPPPQHLPPQVDKRQVKTTGCADFVDYFSAEKPPERDAWESPLERKARRHREKVQAHKDALQKLIDKYDPHKDPNASGDPFKTLFVARISYDTTEKKLKREFEVFGSIKRVRMIYDQKGKPRGYAFIEYEHERDLKNAYKQGDGKKIDGRRVMVDVERGRTVEGWMPRRLGGGRGPGRQGKPSKKKKKAAEAAKEKDRDREKDKEKESTKDRERDREKEKDRDHERERPPREREHKEKEKAPEEAIVPARSGGKKEKEKDKEKDKEKEKVKDKEKDKDKEKEKDKDKDKDQDAPRPKQEKDRDREKKRDRSRSRDRDREKKKSRRED
mmetsp:Transcript_72281/g.211832  ORF Transcript_72281/g.211832 Transcript_72281/m.211832 type:complete len:344 (+) Transcript_72281:100-1131(+)